MRNSINYSLEHVKSPVNLVLVPNPTLLTTAAFVTRMPEPLIERPIGKNSFFWWMATLNYPHLAKHGGLRRKRQYG